MDHRDTELLDKELWGIGHSPKQNPSLIGFIVVATFFAGLTLGGIMFAQEGTPSKVTANGAMAAISLQSGAAPIAR